MSEKENSKEAKPMRVFQDKCLVVAGLPPAYMDELENLAKAMNDYWFLAEQEKLSPSGALNLTRELVSELRMVVVVANT